MHAIVSLALRTSPSAFLSLQRYMADCSFNITLLNIIKIGPWGDKGAPNFDMHCLEIIKVKVYWEIVINGLEITCIEDNGNIKTCLIGRAVGESYEIVLERGEYINCVSASFTNYDNQICIYDLEFGTNWLKKHGLFGKGVGAIAAETITVVLTGGKIVGFFGGADKYVNSIGFYLGGTGNTTSVTIK